MPEWIEPVPSTSLENSVKLENDDPPSEINISVNNYVSTDAKNITYIFCDQKYRFEIFPLFHSIKNGFLSKKYWK